MKKNILLLIAGIFLLGACGKNNELPDPEPPFEEEEEVIPDFDVELVSGTYKAGMK